MPRLKHFSWDPPLLHVHIIFLKIVGCQVCRQPEGSTERYTKWANSLSPEQLYTQVIILQSNSNSRLNYRLLDPYISW